MESRPVPLRFGILAEGHRFPAWAVACIERLQDSGHAQIAAVLEVRSTAGLERRQRAGSLARAFRDRWVGPRSPALRPIDLSERLAGVPVVDLSTPTLSDRARDAIGAAQLDFVLRLDPTAVPDALLDLPRFGVWSFSQEREPAPCFREVVEGKVRTRVALERLTLAGPVCLHEGFFATCRASWVNNIDRARFGAADFCARVCAEIIHNGSDRINALTATPTRDEPAPSNRDIARLLARSGTHAVAKLWELLLHVETWNVGFSSSSLQQIVREAHVNGAGVTWCGRHRPGHFIADPFAYVHQGTARVLVEDYDQVKGRICSIEPPKGPEALELVIDFDLPHHLSYPCIFEEGGETYCVPEAYQSRNASLYRRTDEGWTLVRNLIEGLPIVDPTLFEHEGTYWLLFTLQDDGAWGNQKLYAYHAAALDAPWKPHALNPVKCDIGATRPAGNVFRVDGRLFRPSQDCSRTYGGAVVVNQITKLTPTEFEEHEAARIEPIATGPYPDGLHTLNAMGDRTVFDSKRFDFDCFAWRKNWGRLHEVLR